MPGPGAYDVRPSSRDGSSVLSKYPSIRNGRFSTSSRSEYYDKKFKSGTHLNYMTENDVLKDTPGPGSYIAPSEFGIYVSSKALNASLGSFRSSNNSFMANSSISKSQEKRPRTSQETINLKRILDPNSATPKSKSHRVAQTTYHSRSQSQSQSLMSTDAENWKANSMIADNNSTQMKKVEKI